MHSIRPRRQRRRQVVPPFAGSGSRRLGAGDYTEVMPAGQPTLYSDAGALSVPVSCSS
jgi:hypothetical protein